MEYSIHQSPVDTSASASVEQVAAAAKLPSTCFSSRRLNATTFLIVEDDKWRESPFIYAKVYDSVIVLLDTGCGGASKDPDVQLKSLRAFIETYPVSDNEDEPINPTAEKDYIVICTHCHYDHIGGIEQFKDDPKSAIWASAYDRDFIDDETMLPTHSLCRFVGMQTPRYKVTHWAADGEHVRYGNNGLDLGLVVYQTPGHTPDELAVWDPVERVLFVGDTAYEWGPILFPFEGSIPLYKEKLNKLRSLVRDLNAGHRGSDVLINSSLKLLPINPNKIKRVSLASGHTTSDADAEFFLDEVYEFLCKIEQGEVESRPWRKFRGEEEVLYEREDGKISFASSRNKFVEFTHKPETGCCLMS
ncbi:Metallo-hydrolase/oxidoreductase [Dothidotthia symphoricarpi CBS 119687]|uniref:Metallo-hydrolase/oxidoreductase n=1 Tax=Dothidotthia symphoricarpi CBS 119687 TaxID=1392245 RepID=A0A6A6A362_9PLEO|nr:Metallo-hydrolase/oxidoreductase [Dothidotthia symphoricarpi CBS 119687]KAF2125603.1 Metallo-hydrolase/oxidoreductase [Dothidotthia symphoricarpi CBS 119687]